MYDLSLAKMRCLRLSIVKLIAVYFVKILPVVELSDY